MISCWLCVQHLANSVCQIFLPYTFNIQIYSFLFLFLVTCYLFRTSVFPLIWISWIIIWTWFQLIGMFGSLCKLYKLVPKNAKSIKTSVDILRLEFSIFIMVHLRCHTMISISISLFILFQTLKLYLKTTQVIIILNRQGRVQGPVQSLSPKSQRVKS